MRILGVDIGSTSIKAVELDSAFGRYEVHEYHERQLAPGENPVEALGSFVQGLPRPPDRIAAALPTSRVTFRNLHLPTRDKKAIQSGITFELEDELPFALEQGLFDHCILSQSKQGTDVHVAAALRGTIVGALESWSAAGLDPDLLTTEAWAYRTYLNRILPASTQEAPVLVAQMGQERTTLYVHLRGTPILTRELPWGGRDLTQAIAERYGIPLDQAEQAKRDHGFVLSSTQEGEVTREQVEFSSTLIKPLQTLLSELRQAILTCKSLTHQNVSSLYIAGGTALLPGLQRVLEENLAIPTQPLQSLSSISPSGVNYSEQADGPFLLAAALALCLVGPDRAATINFRKGEFAKLGRAREINIATLRKPMIAVGAVLSCMMISLWVQRGVYQGQLADMDGQLERSVKGFFGQLSSGAVKTYLADPGKLKNSVKKEISKQRELADLMLPNERSPLNYLKSLSGAIPKDVVVDMTRYQVGAAPTEPFAKARESSTVSLTFLVANPQIAAKLDSILGSRIQDKQQSKLEEVPSPDGTGKRWKVTYTGKPSEAAYGK